MCGGAVSPPLLRAPPFPGAVEMLGSADAGLADWREIDPELVRSNAAAMVRGRVGGAFWQERHAGRSRLIVLGVKDAIPSGDLGDAVVLAKGQAARCAQGQGAIVFRADAVDPWPLIDAAEIVFSAPDTEIALLALAAEVVVVDPTSGRAVEGVAPIARALFGRRYHDPLSGAAIDVADWIARLVTWRQLIDANRGLSAATGMAFWKRREVARLLWDGQNRSLPFLKPAAAIGYAKREGGAIAAWPARVPANFVESAAAAGVPVRWVEDGFLRSAGLGSDLLPPLSLILDDLWPYFDPARPSRLETILETREFDELLLARASALRANIVERRIGKYRVGGEATSVDTRPGARLVAVVGQVEDDLSMLRGGHGLTNLSVVKRARAEEPDAYIVYRPHPDVEAGHRKGAIPDPLVLTHVNRIDRGGSLDALLARADTLHTITSLSGFEALMRGVRVVVHGSPFYAGWGLTEDRGPPLPRRTRRLTLDQLVAGALILYPRYLDPPTGLPCTPEVFVEGLGRAGVHGGWLVRLRRWQGRSRASLQRFLG